MKYNFHWFQEGWWLQKIINPVCKEWNLSLNEINNYSIKEVLKLKKALNSINEAKNADSFYESEKMRIKDKIQKEASKITKNEINVSNEFLNKVIADKYSPKKTLNKALAFLQKQEESRGKNDKKTK